MKMSVEDQMTQLTNKMLLEKVFNCASCGHLLTLPITLVENLGNVCFECFTKNQHIGIPNVGLEKILSELKLPCRFQLTGCKERVFHKDLENHERDCKYYERPCLIAHDGCNWKGIQSDFPSHFIDSHSEHVLTNLCSAYVLEVNVETTVNITKFLRGRKECILQIQSDKTHSNLLHTLLDVQSEECDYELCIKYIGSNGSSVESICKVMPFKDPKESVKINLIALKQLICLSDNVTIQIKHVNEGKIHNLDEKMLHYFECPVCKTLMRPPIYQCKFGHSFCNNCRPRLEKCPNCRGLFETTRNYALEGLTAEIPYTCMYHHLGCEEILSVNDSSKHESVCAYKPYPCPLDDCSFKGTRLNIGRHLNEKHQDKLIPRNFFKTTVEFRLEQMMDFYNLNQKFYLVFDENIFRLSFKRNSDYSFWAVEVLRQKDNEDVFVYDIGIIDMRKPDRKLIRCDSCFTDINHEDLFKKCILFPNNILASYACNGMFTYYCQIGKRQ